MQENTLLIHGGKDFQLQCYHAEYIIWVSERTTGVTCVDLWQHCPSTCECHFPCCISLLLQLQLLHSHTCTKHSLSYHHSHWKYLKNILLFTPVKCPVHCLIWECVNVIYIEYSVSYNSKERIWLCVCVSCMPCTVCVLLCIYVMYVICLFIPFVYHLCVRVCVVCVCV